ncbi:hypothetical protein [Halosimplex salinum]|uniref:hypothetical protein n=1 Tax=Halosimplex salinum TaxID=1710538 RepID=UPI000F489696|nr:hypothetical protein [Halosimplex salinum]
MSSTGVGSRLVAATSRHALRVVGFVTVLMSAGVASMSVTTEYGLTVGSESAGQTAAYAADVGTIAAFAEFAAAHPAYPAAVLVGFVLVVAGDETPLIGD